MDTQMEARWFETDFARALQQKCDSVSTELCDAAHLGEMQLPFEIEFLDGRGSFCELTVNEDRAEWNWKNHIKHDQQVEEPLTAVLKSHDGRSMCKKKFSLLDSLTANGKEPIEPSQQIRGGR